MDEKHFSYKNDLASWEHAYLSTSNLAPSSFALYKTWLIALGPTLFRVLWAGLLSQNSGAFPALIRRVGVSRVVE